MTTTQTTPSTPAATRPRPVELAHYTANAQERVLIGHRVDRQRQITDAPAGGAGHSYSSRPTSTPTARCSPWSATTSPRPTPTTPSPWPPPSSTDQPDRTEPRP